MIALALVHIFMNNNYVGLPWKKALWIGYSIMLLGTLLYTRVIYLLRLMHKPYKVHTINQERGVVWTIRLIPKDHKGFNFQPGQFAWLTAWKTPFSDTEHPFSLASNAEKRDYIEMSIKNLGPFTSTTQNLKSSQKVFVDGPYVHFGIDHFPDTKRFIFIPGGI